MNMRLTINQGFTLIELLVTISIIGILVAMLLPASQAVREASRRIGCSNNQRQFALAVHSYESAFGTIPPTIGLTRKKNFLLHWQAILTPYLEQEPLFSRIQANLENSVHVFNMDERIVQLPIFECPSEADSGFLIEADTGKFAFTSYCGVGGVQLAADDGVFIAPDLWTSPSSKNRGISFGEIRDGLSNTLMIGERPPNDSGYGYGAWLGSQNFLAAAVGVGETHESLFDDIQLTGCNGSEFEYGPGIRGSACGWTHHWSYHPGGSNFGRSDASTHSVSYEIDRSVLVALATRDAGDIVDSE